MGYIITRTDGSTDGLGDHVVFATVQEAVSAAEKIGLERYEVKPTDEEPMTDGNGVITR